MNEIDFYDIAIASDDQYDHDFMRIFENEALKYNLKTYDVLPQNLDETLYRLNEKKLNFGYLLDRASNTSIEFIAFHHLMRKNKIPVLDSLENIMRASDKATMHLEFITNGIITPYTIILPPIKDSEDIHHIRSNIDKIGRPFIIKPATITGGGKGVVNGAETLEDILRTRKEFHIDKYLIQEKVNPRQICDKRFWFRGFYACGYIALCWWNDITKIYTPVTDEDIAEYGLAGIREIIQKISEISDLKFFSSEIAQKDSGQFVVVDYVNETCDMRLKSKCRDGVPDETVLDIIKALTAFIKDNTVS